MNQTFSNSDDIIDSRDVIARINEMENELEEGAAPCDELVILRKLQDEASNSADWEHGETLIRGSYFKEYAQQLADDIGAVNNDATWPNNCIDWDRATRELKMDYTEVDFDGVEYLIRS